MTEQINTPFDPTYISAYETASSITRAYETTAKAMANRLKILKPTPIVALDIGSGTGNSSIVFTEIVPQITRLYCIEPSDMIWHANNKLAGKIIDETDLISKEYSTEMIDRVKPNNKKIHFIKASGEFIPLSANSVDAVLCCQSFHWLNSTEALASIHRILQSNGLLLLDESGYHINLGSKMNRLHVTNHPFFKLFQQNLYSVLVNENILSEKNYKTNRDYLYTPISLKTEIENAGYKLMPDGEKPFTLIELPYSFEQIKAVAYYGARMRMARDFPLLDLNLVDKIIQRTIKTTENINLPNEFFNKPYRETFAEFVFKKI